MTKNPRPAEDLVNGGSSFPKRTMASPLPLWLTVAATAAVVWCPGQSMAAGPPGPVSLTLIPPSPVTDKIFLDIRGAVWNQGAAAKSFDVTVFLDQEDSANVLHSESLHLGPGLCKGTKFRWATDGHAGHHTLLLVAKSDVNTYRITQPIEILASDVRSTRRIDGAWFEFYHWSEAEGKPWNEEIRKTTDGQWKEMVAAMHRIGMDLVIVQEVFRNQEYVGKHSMETDGYTGRAYYPSKLYPQRRDIAATDPLGAVLAEADKHGMHVMVGVGCYAWFDFTPGSLAWHKRVADELWEQYGHHRSFYGWYVSEEIPGHLGAGTARRREIVRFFREFKEHVNTLAPDKPVMLATNCHCVAQSEGYYPKLLEHLDILCPFGFHRMPAGDYSGDEVARMLQQHCDQAGAHLWMDMEVFVFGRGNALLPRPIDGVIDDLMRFPDFEKICCYAFTGLMNSPDQSRKPGGKATVRLYNDYRKLVLQARNSESGPEPKN